MTDSYYHLEACEFGQVLEIWSTELWPDRQSPIEIVSCITETGEIDGELMREKAYFWRALDDSGKVIGVISGFKTGAHSYRSRGIWVDPRFRNQGVGRLLMNQNIEKAKDLHAKYLWTMPRKSSWGFYQQLGFQATQELNQFEYGPHLIAKLEF